MVDAYDELPYDSAPIEWAAPERMSVTSLLHGGPRVAQRGYRYLELGCGDATNLIPLARYRPDAHFIGVDGSRVLMQRAQRDRDALGLTNLELIAGSFEEVCDRLEGPYEYIVLHGVFSWIADTERDRLLAFCARALHAQGLLYVSYNALPGWGVRGLVRDQLRAQCARLDGDLRARAEHARSVAAELAELLRPSDYPYSQLLVRELEHVRDSNPTYVAHEFLAPHNRAYWRSEFKAALAQHGFDYVAEADFAYPTARMPEGLSSWLATRNLVGTAVEDVADWLCFAQFRCALLCRASARRASALPDALRDLSAVSLMQPQPGADPPVLHTPEGLEVSFTDPQIEHALRELTAQAPRAQPLSELFASVDTGAEDLLLLHRAGAIELVEPIELQPLSSELQALEQSRRGEYTSERHRRVRDPLATPSYNLKPTPTRP